MTTLVTPREVIDLAFADALTACVKAPEKTVKVYA